MKQTEATNLEMASQPKNVTPGERLHFLRKQLLHINQRDFAQQANLSISTYTKLESNKLNYSRITLRKLEKAFGITEKWLLHGEGDIPQNLETIVAKRRAKTKTTVVQQRDLSDEKLDFVISMAIDPQVQTLAAQLSETLSISPDQAMAEIIIGKMNAAKKSPAKRKKN